MSIMIWHGERAKDRVRQGAVRGLEEWASAVFEGSQARVPVAPIGGGFLRDSAKAEVDEGELVAAVSYDSPPPRADGRAVGSGNLAVWVHEDMSTHHAAGGSAKYLELPLNESRDSGPELVRRAIKEAIG